MKAIIIILLLGICLSYDFYYPIAAIKYALKYCKNYNPGYNNYKLRKDGQILLVNVCIMQDKVLMDALEEIRKV